MADEFDANEPIAGFPLVSIQKALVWVGVMDDRDDIKSVGEALGCGPRQAAGVLDDLERRGLVAKGKKRNQWAKTEKGHRLAFQWEPPRRYRPVIERDDKGNPGNEQLEGVPCLLFESRDDAEIFEEARLNVLFFPDYEGSHLVEVSVFEPADYEQPESDGTYTTSVYLTPADARVIATGILRAADKAEAEVARRAKHPPKHRPIPKNEPVAKAPELSKREAVPPVVAADPRIAKRAEADARKKSRQAVAATVAELGGRRPT